MAHRLVLALLSPVCALALTGCISNPEPAPLLVATPSPTPTSSAIAAASPTPIASNSPTPSSTSFASTTRKPTPQSSQQPVTEDDLAAAVAATLPRFRVHIDPSPQTRVGLDTNFYTEPQRYARTLIIRGRSVAVSGKVFYYEFAFGDGARKSSTSPGKAFPGSEITHRFTKAGTYSPHVTAYFAITYSVAGDAWRSLPDKIASVGPSTTLKVLAE